MFLTFFRLEHSTILHLYLLFRNTLQSHSGFDTLSSCDLTWRYFQSQLPCMFSPKSDFITTRVPHQGPVPTPRWVPMLCVSCVDQWADLIWADPSDAPLSPILCRCSRMPHWPPWWASGGLYLNPADSNKHTPPPSSPQQIDCCQNNESLWSSDTVSAGQFSEVKPLNAFANMFPLNLQHSSEQRAAMHLKSLCQ